MEIPCVVKLYYNQDSDSYSRCPKEHSCRLSLKMTDSMHHIVLENPNVFLKRYPLKPDCVAEIVTRRIDDGALTVAFKPGYMLNQLVVSHAEDKPALRTFAESLDKVCFGRTRGNSLPLSPPVTPEREQSGSALSAKKKLSLHLPSRSSLPAERYGLKPAQFYSPSVLSTAPSLPLSPQKTLTPVNYRRSLVVPNDVLTTPPSKPAAKRLPLTVLCEPQGTLNPQGTMNSQGILKKRRVLYPPLGDQDELEGFANLGNTCYMNAVLQSLLGLDPFAEDLYNQTLVRKVSPKSLYMLLYLLLKSKRAKESFESQRVLLTSIKHIIAQTAAKFSGSRQQDAHELLAQCLDQLKQDTEKIDCPGDGQGEKGQMLSPVVRNFECEIMHTITCKGCGKTTQKPEIIYDFALQLPKSVILMQNEQANLQQLFDLYFASEDVEYNCSVCGNKMATLSHQLSKLPRVLIVYLKRYGFNAHACKRIDSIHIPRIINAGPCCVDGVGIPYEFTGPWPRDPVQMSEGKENVISDVKVENWIGTPSRTAVAPQSNMSSPGGMAMCKDLSQGSEGMMSHFNAMPTLTPTPTPTLTPTPTPIPSSIPTSPQLSLLSDDFHKSVSQNGGDNADVSIVDVAHDNIAMSIDPLDFPTPSDSENLSDTAKKILGSGDVVGVASEGVVRNGYTKLPTLRKFSYLKRRVKRVTSSSDIMDDFDKLCDDINDDGSLKETPTKPPETPPLANEDCALNCTIPPPLEGDCHGNGIGLNGSSLAMHHHRSGNQTSNGHGHLTEGHVTNGHSHTPADHVTNGHGHLPADHVTNGHSHVPADHVTNGHGHVPADHVTNGHGHVTNGHSHLSTSSDRPVGPAHHGRIAGPSQQEGGGGLHVTDLEEEENELLKQALEESTRSQPAELVRLQELGMSEEDQLKLALELSIQDSSSVEEMVALPAVASDMPVCATPDHEAQAHTFRLMSIVNHIGKGSGGGHYITDVNCVRDGTWKSFNDSVVVEVKEEDVRQRRQCSGYIFFYMYKVTYQSVVKHSKPS